MSEQKLKNRREFSADFKLRLVVQLVSGAKSMAEIGREYKIKDTVLARWRDQFLEQAPNIFQRGAAGQTGDARFAELERVIGKQHLEIEVLKKASKRLL